MRPICVPNYSRRPALDMHAWVRKESVVVSRSAFVYAIELDHDAMYPCEPRRADPMVQCIFSAGDIHIIVDLPASEFRRAMEAEPPSADQ